MHLQPVPVGVEPAPNVGILMGRGVVLNQNRPLPTVSPGELLEEDQIAGGVEDRILPVVEARAPEFNGAEDLHGFALSGDGNFRRATVVLVNSDLADNLGVAVLPSIAFGPDLLGALRVLLRLLPEPCSAAVGSSRSASSIKCSAPLRQASETDPGGSAPVGLALRSLGGLAVQYLPRPTRDGDRLAPEGLSSLLGREDSVGKTGKARRAEGDPRFDSDHEPGESDLGRSANSQRVTEAGH
jgi:hypothetical protein